MNFLHQKGYYSAGDIIVLQCNTQCNFMIMSDSNFSSYRERRDFNHYGGHFKSFPAKIKVPSSGSWNVVIDLGGGAANIRYGLSVIKAR